MVLTTLKPPARQHREVIKVKGEERPSFSSGASQLRLVARCLHAKFERVDDIDRLTSQILDEPNRDVMVQVEPRRLFLFLASHPSRSEGKVSQV